MSIVISHNPIITRIRKVYNTTRLILMIWQSKWPHGLMHLDAVRRKQVSGLICNVLISTLLPKTHLKGKNLRSF